MFPYLTKLFWVLFSPLSVIVILLVAGFGLSFSRLRRLSRWVTGLAIVLLFGVCATNLGTLAIRPLERQFPMLAEPARIDGIVVLGGGMDGELNGANHGWELNRFGDRFVEALRLALRHPEAKVLIAGGIAVLSEAQETEAAAGARFFEAFGIAPSRLLLDDRSRNTEENAVFSKAIAKPEPDETWVLVTSAFHMPRAVGLFRRVGFEVLPWPTDYFTAGDEGPAFNPESASDNLAVASVAAREWAGLVGYYLSGKIDQILPGP
jgi:uncharacterized SAM-binding protein YcdF (DUF218 family)